MKNGTYHKTLGFPAEVSLRPVLGLVASGHARERAGELNIKEIPLMFSPATSEVIELTVNNNTVEKILARKSLDEKRDVCYVFLTATKVIKTVWVNMKDDKHFTLDKTRFVRP